MAPLIAMRGVNPSSDEAVANVTAGAQSGFHVAAIMRIHIHSVIGSFCLGGLNQFAHHLIGVGAAGVFGADGDLPPVQVRPSPTQPMSTEMASVTPCRHRSCAAMAHFFINGHMDVNPAFRGHAPCHAGTWPGPAKCPQTACLIEAQLMESAL